VHPGELLFAESEQREDEELEREERELQADLECLLSKTDEVSRKRSDFLEKKEGTRLREERNMLMQAVTAEGTWVPLIVEDQEHLQRVDLRGIDVATCVLKEEWGRGWRFCRESKPMPKWKCGKLQFSWRKSPNSWTGSTRSWPRLLIQGSWRRQRGGTAYWPVD
jgi:hypothetical protein